MKGTYIIEVKFKNAAGEMPACVLDFYVNKGGERLTLSSESLVRITTEDGERFFLFLNSMKFPHGRLMCRVSVVDDEPLVERPLSIEVPTGIIIGNCNEGAGEVTRCGDYEFGFGLVDDVPKDINARIYIGVIKDWVTGYEHITEEMIQGVLTEFPVGAVETNINVIMGDKVVALIPCNEHLTARKGDGFGGKVPFGGFMSSNGEIVLRVNGIDYKVYGEMMTVNGEMEIFV